MSKYIPVKLAYKAVEPVSGSEDKSPIIFLHGVVTSKEYWSDIPQTVADATKRMVYLLDARNHGDSEWSDDFNFDINSEDLVHFMDTMNISKAVLLGHNMGGVTAIRTALKKKERVEMLIAEDTLVRKFPKPVLDMIITQLTMAQQAVDQMPSDINEGDAEKFIFDFIYSHIPDEIKAVMKKRDIDEQRRLISLRRNSHGRYGFKSNLKVILNALQNIETLMEEPSGVYDGPAYFIYGEHSPFSVKTDEQEIRKFFPNAEFEAIKDASHAVHIDCPREFIDAILKFLSRT